MSINLLHAIKNYFSEQLINKAAGYLGEDEFAIRKGLDVVIPASLAGIIHRSETGNTESLLVNARDSFNSGILHHLSDTFSAAGGGIPSISPSLISSIFGDKFGGFANAVSGFTGLKGSSSSSLIGSVLPLALALLGKHAMDTNATPGQISSLLASQKHSILSAIPAGFDISKFVGVKEKIKEPVYHAPLPEKARNKWLLPLLLGIAGLLLLLWWMKGCGQKEETVQVITDTVVTTKTDTLVISKEPIKVTLPNGVILEAYKGGIEDLLVAFLLDSVATAGKDNWFDFNELNFKFGTAEIIPESRKEIDNIKEILTAFPKAKIKIGGYTDKVGNEPANKKLSKDRANAVASALKELGVGGQLMGAEGYGSEFAKYPADAPEQDRIKDRRVSVSVREK